MEKVGRVCAICGKRHRRVQGILEATTGFKELLRSLGHPNWQHDKAHPTCVRELQQKANKS